VLDFLVVDVVVVAVVAVSCITGAVELADIVLVSAVDIAAVVSAVLSFFLEHPPSATPASTSTAIAAPSLKVPLTLPPPYEAPQEIPVKSIRRRLGVRRDWRQQRCRLGRRATIT